MTIPRARCWRQAVREGRARGACVEEGASILCEVVARRDQSSPGVRASALRNSASREASDTTNNVRPRLTSVQAMDTCVAAAEDDEILVNFRNARATAV